MKYIMPRLEQERIAKEVKSLNLLMSVKEMAQRYNMTVALAESIIARYDIDFRETPNAAELRHRLTEEIERFRERQERDLSRACMMQQIEEAKLAAKTEKPFKKGLLEW